MHRAYRTKLRTTTTQAAYFEGCAGVARFVYNWALADRKSRYEQGLSTNKFEQKKRFNSLKTTEFPWLAQYPQVIGERAFDNLDNAYNKFFQRVKEGKEKPGFPRFKNRHNSRRSFCLGVNRIHIEHGRVKLPHIGWIKLAEKGYIPSTGSEGIKLYRVTISEQAGEWFISAQMEVPDPRPLPLHGTVGIDLGVKALATTSDGSTFNNPKTLRRYEKRLARLQRELFRRQKGSSNRNKTRAKIAKLHNRIGNVRSHTLHNISAHVVYNRRPACVVVENLDVRGMGKNHRLAKAVNDAAMGKLRRQIEYKAAWSGVRVVVANRFYPSSKRCSGCGHVKESLALSERTYICENCGVVLDRDLNAALNLVQYAK
jgi:putative transposase